MAHTATLNRAVAQVVPVHLSLVPLTVSYLVSLSWTIPLHRDGMPCLPVWFEPALHFDLFSTDWLCNCMLCRSFPLESIRLLAFCGVVLLCTRTARMILCGDCPTSDGWYSLDLHVSLSSTCYLNGDFYNQFPLNKAQNTVTIIIRSNFYDWDNTDG